jgi:hypothetical protein
MSSFTGAGRSRNSASETKSDHKRLNSADNLANSSLFRGMDEKLFNTCVDLLEVFTKKASAEQSFVSELVAVNHSSREVDSVVSSILGGMASKRFLESNSGPVLWVSLMQVLDSIPALFSAEQCGELRDGSEDTLSLLGNDAADSFIVQTQLSVVLSCTTSYCCFACRAPHFDCRSVPHIFLYSIHPSIPVRLLNPNPNPNQTTSISHPSLYLPSHPPSPHHLSLSPQAHPSPSSPSTSSAVSSPPSKPSPTPTPPPTTTPPTPSPAPSPSPSSAH